MTAAIVWAAIGGALIGPEVVAAGVLLAPWHWSPGRR